MSFFTVPISAHSKSDDPLCSRPSSPRKTKQLIRDTARDFAPG